MADPSPFEESLARFGKRMGCLADERSFRLETIEFVGVAPPRELVQSTGWSFMQEKHGNPAFIGFGNSSEKAIASFDLPCAGDRGVLDIGYLLSYGGMGAVKVAVEGLDKPVVIDGLWGTIVSVQGYEIISIPTGLDTVRVTFEVLSVESEAPYAAYLFNATAGSEDRARGDRKFKLVSMQCC